MKKHLKSQYGFSDFRDFQEEIIKDILEGRDSIVLFPTGGGKSLCYQFPATFLNKKSIVVSPLISLMNDQQLHLSHRGIKCVCLNGESKQARRSLLTSSKYKISKEIQEAKVIYCTPEFLTSNIELFQSLDDICLFAIDEAHCVSEWGNDFRTSYMKLKMIKKTFKNIPVVALTATATPIVLEDIFNSLELEDANQYQLGTTRENLSIHVREKSDNILDDLDIQDDESTIIYTQTRKDTEKIYKLLKADGINAGYYHAGLSIEHKNKTHNDFVKDKITVIVATICFGMGIDKPDIRKVINYGSPCNLETYYQEIGRAGRDGMPSTVVLFHADGDYNINNFLISKSDSKGNKRDLLDTFQKYIINSKTCRQLLIEHYFETGKLSGKISNKGKCGTCDNCTGVSTHRKTENLLKEAKLIVGLVDSLPVNYGVSKLIAIIRGSDGKFFENKYYNTGVQKSVDWWKKFINIMVGEDYLAKNAFSFYTVIGLGVTHLEDSPLNLYMPSPKITQKSNRKYKSIRSKIAKFENVSPYMIVNDKVLAEISSHEPKTISELFDIDGVSSDFICKYGKIFISVFDTSTRKSSTKDTSYTMFQEGDSINKISKIRGLKEMTIESHVIDKLTENPSEIDHKRLGITDTMIAQVSQAVSTVGKERLRHIKVFLEDTGIQISYFHIKICLISV